MNFTFFLGVILLDLIYDIYKILLLNQKHLYRFGSGYPYRL